MTECSRSIRPLHMYVALFAVGGASTLSSVLISVALWTAAHSVHDVSLVTVGMTIEDVVARMGPPDRVTEAGQPFDPPNVNGFVPNRSDFHLSYTYNTFPGRYVYVLFDEDEIVLTYYVCGT